MMQQKDRLEKQLDFIREIDKKKRYSARLI